MLFTVIKPSKIDTKCHHKLTIYFHNFPIIRKRPQCKYQLPIIVSKSRIPITRKTIMCGRFIYNLQYLVQCFLYLNIALEFINIQTRMADLFMLTLCGLSWTLN